jgi:hypothetical protein
VSSEQFLETGFVSKGSLGVGNQESPDVRHWNEVEGRCVPEADVRRQEGEWDEVDAELPEAGGCMRSPATE